MVFFGLSLESNQICEALGKFKSHKCDLRVWVQVLCEVVQSPQSSCMPQVACEVHGRVESADFKGWMGLLSLGRKAIWRVWLLSCCWQHTITKNQRGTQTVTSAVSNVLAPSAERNISEATDTKYSNYIKNVLVFKCVCPPLGLYLLRQQ